MKRFTLTVLSVLLCCFCFVLPQIETARAWSGTVHITASGSIDPPDAPIQRSGEVYTLTGNIIGSTDGIVIERDGVTLDGMGYTVQGKASLSPDYFAIVLNGRSSVLIKNFVLNASLYGIFLNESLNTIVVGNEMANLWTAVRIEGSYETLYTPSNNNITGNEMTKNSVGIYLTLTLNNSISGNVIEDGSEGITLDHANRNSIM
jgi:parallel beta-helix repeat protein